MGFSKRQSLVPKKTRGTSVPSENISPLTQEEIACVPLVLLEPFLNHVILETQTPPRVKQEANSDKSTIILKNQNFLIRMVLSIMIYMSMISAQRKKKELQINQEPSHQYLFLVIVA